MRLKHIKLVGFKSFVDPTKVPFPHQMTCVVGPNGCGKSNVIDAVRWVLGESSAKNLRGDAMTDVIFNGSTARKPVSQASVELVFDNSEGRIQGEFANYAEISVKRVVTRDAQSSYLLNGSKCRRRDITDLFLGTGLGPRSYAIIEQGMISRLIESKPQELRVFIEEAAGISKYKERRRETESRMQHTRENLDRLHDVRDELGKQLDKLEKQAAAALRYKTLKADERRYKAELQALRWLANDEQVQQARTQQQQHENELEHWISQQRGNESEHDTLQEQERELKQQLDQVHQQYYQLGNDVTRTEQQLHHQRQLSAQRTQRLQQVNDDLTQLQQQLAEDEAAQQEHAEQLALLTPEYDLAAAELAELGEQRDAAEDALQVWHDRQQAQLNERQQWQHELRELKAQAESKSDKLAYLRERMAEVEGEQILLQESLQQAQLEQEELPTELVAAQVIEQEQSYATVLESMNEAQTNYDDLLEAIDDRQQQRQSLHGKISSVEHSLASQHQQWQAELQDWLTTHGIETLGDVSDFVPTGSAWQTALTQALQPWLSVPLLQSWPAVWPTIQGARFIVLNAADRGAAPAQSLAAELPQPLQQWPFLQSIGLASDPAQALQMLNEPSEPWQSVICRDGQWLTKQHYQHQQISEADSSLRWREELAQLQTHYAEVSEQLSQLEQQRDATRQRLTELAQQRDLQLQQLQQSQARAIELRERQQYSQQQVQERQRQLNQSAEQLVRLTDEVEQLTADYEELSEQVVTCETREPVAAQRSETELVAEREQLQQRRQQLREQTQQQQQKVQQLETQRQQLLAYQSQGQTLLQRLQQHQRQLEEQRSQLLENSTAGNADASAEVQEELQLQLEELLEKRSEVEYQRSRLQDQVSELEAELKQRNSGQQGIVQAIDKARQQLEASKLELSALAERSRNILAVLEEMNQPLKGILTELPENANEREWQTTLDRLQQSIGRLGAINLAAIEEAELQAERKAYLDTQHDDLQSSLETLESAIRKIDKETRQRFRTTFDAVNGDLQTLFPKVFGGGHAYLELTDDDLLDTGVTIMARPPGKKNSTIHLLSGGEKALTALSLVFAIFRLNPAPFCLLDEVDAPLDDANVARFCRLVEEMSETVQFIYISHNKVAMEMASHLAGVTMQEAGVSRLVAVDVEAAVAMVEA